MKLARIPHYHTATPCARCAMRYGLHRLADLKCPGNDTQPTRCELIKNERLSDEIYEWRLNRWYSIRNTHFSPV